MRADAPRFTDQAAAVRWMNGKTVATPQGSCTDRIAQATFQKLGVKPKQYLNQSLDAGDPARGRLLVRPAPDVARRPAVPRATPRGALGKRPPSRIIREQVRFATQPIEPFTAAQLQTLIGQMESDELLCFSTDYPHWDFDSPLTSLPPGLPDDLAAKIFHGNARATYPRLPAPVPA